MDCIFCRILAGEIPAFTVFENEDCLAFMDINPIAEGHLLVIPKKHVEGLFDADDATLAAVVAVSARLARALKQALGLDSLNLVQANGPWAMQSVPHLHFHLIPRREGDNAPLDWDLQPGDMEAIRQLGDRVAAAVE